MSLPLVAALTVRTYELDSFGHVNNSVYFQYLEAARAEYLRQLGISFDDFARVGVQLVITEAFLRYLSPARYGDEIEVAGTFSEVGAARLTISYRLTERRSGRLLAEGWTRGAFYDPQRGRPTRAPEPFASAFREAARATPPAGGSTPAPAE